MNKSNVQNFKTFILNKIQDNKDDFQGMSDYKQEIKLCDEYEELEYYNRNVDLKIECSGNPEKYRALLLKNFLLWGKV